MKPSSDAHDAANGPLATTASTVRTISFTRGSGSGAAGRGGAGGSAPGRGGAGGGAAGTGGGSAGTGVAGTTGYEWLTCLSRLLVDETGRKKLEGLWRSIAPELGDFAAGSMGPKVRAACSFVERTGGVAAIGSIHDTEALVRGEAGTRVARAGT